MQQTSTQTISFSIFGSFIWMLIFIFGIQFVLVGLADIALKLMQVSDEVALLYFYQPIFIVLTSAISLLVSIPLIKAATYQSGKSFPFKFLAINAINLRTLAKVLLLGFVYVLLESIIADWLQISTPQFMLELQAQTQTAVDMALLVLGIGFFVPLFEELVFRGVIYQRLVQSRAGVSGAVLITSLVFTAVHTQYEFSVLALLSVSAFLLGYVRYKTDNLLYCIALHMQLNLLSIISLFVFA